MPERKLILSERAAMLSELIKLLKPGDEVEGVVTRTTDYGAFVSLVGSDGRMHGAEARSQPAVIDAADRCCRLKSDNLRAIIYLAVLYCAVQAWYRYFQTVVDL